MSNLENHRYNEHKEALSLWAAREVMTFVFDNRKLDAVKELRGFTGWGIQACMAWIDKMKEFPREYFFFKSEYERDEPEPITFPEKVTDTHDDVNMLTNPQLRIICSNIRKLRNTNYDLIDHEKDVLPYTKMLMIGLHTTQRNAINILYEIVANEVLERFEQNALDICVMPSA